MINFQMGLVLTLFLEDEEEIVIETPSPKSSSSEEEIFPPLLPPVRPYRPVIVQSSKKRLKFDQVSSTPSLSCASGRPNNQIICQDTNLWSKAQAMVPKLKTNSHSHLAGVVVRGGFPVFLGMPKPVPQPQLRVEKVVAERVNGVCPTNLL